MYGPSALSLSGSTADPHCPQHAVAAWHQGHIAMRVRNTPTTRTMCLGTTNSSGKTHSLHSPGCGGQTERVERKATCNRTTLPRRAWQKVKRIRRAARKARTRHPQQQQLLARMPAVHGTQRLKFITHKGSAKPRKRVRPFMRCHPHSTILRWHRRSMRKTGQQLQDADRRLPEEGQQRWQEGIATQHLPDRLCRPRRVRLKRLTALDPRSRLPQKRQHLTAPNSQDQQQMQQQQRQQQQRRRLSLRQQQIQCFPGSVSCKRTDPSAITGVRAAKAMPLERTTTTSRATTAGVAAATTECVLPSDPENDVEAALDTHNVGSCDAGFVADDESEGEEDGDKTQVVGKKGIMGGKDKGSHHWQRGRETAENRLIATVNLPPMERPGCESEQAPTAPAFPRYRILPSCSLFCRPRLVRVAEFWDHAIAAHSADQRMLADGPHTDSRAAVVKRGGNGNGRGGAVAGGTSNNHTKQGRHGQGTGANTASSGAKASNSKGAKNGSSSSSSSSGSSSTTTTNSSSSSSSSGSGSGNSSGNSSSSSSDSDSGSSSSSSSSSGSSDSSSSSGSSSDSSSSDNEDEKEAKAKPAAGQARQALAQQQARTRAAQPVPPGGQVPGGTLQPTGQTRKRAKRSNADGQKQMAARPVPFSLQHHHQHQHQHRQSAAAQGYHGHTHHRPTTAAEGAPFAPALAARHGHAPPSAPDAFGGGVASGPPSTAASGRMHPMAHAPPMAPYPEHQPGLVSPSHMHPRPHAALPGPHGMPHPYQTPHGYPPHPPHVRPGAAPPAGYAPGPPWPQQHYQGVPPRYPSHTRARPTPAQYYPFGHRPAHTTYTEPQPIPLQSQSSSSVRKSEGFLGSPPVRWRSPEELKDMQRQHLRDAYNAINSSLDDRSVITSKIPEVISKLQRALDLSKYTAPARAVKIPRGERLLGMCQQCFKHNRPLHRTAPLCTACVKHNSQNIKHMLRHVPEVNPVEHLSYFIWASLGRFFSHSRHTCRCPDGPSHMCPCARDNPETSLCVPCRFLRGLAFVIIFNMWPREIRLPVPFQPLHGPPQPNVLDIPPTTTTTTSASSAPTTTGSDAATLMPTTTSQAVATAATAQRGTDLSSGQEQTTAATAVRPVTSSAGASEDGTEPAPSSAEVPIDTTAMMPPTMAASLAAAVTATPTMTADEAAGMLAELTPIATAPHATLRRASSIGAADAMPAVTESLAMSPATMGVRASRTSAASLFPTPHPRARAVEANSNVRHMHSPNSQPLRDALLASPTPLSADELSGLVPLSLTTSLAPETTTEQPVRSTPSATAMPLTAGRRVAGVAAPGVRLSDSKQPPAQRHM